MLITVPPATGGTPAVYINLPEEELTGMRVEIPAINKMRVLVAPPVKDYVWRTFGLAWGELSPAGVTLDITITHGQYGMIMHEDPWIHSLVDYTYPHSLTLMRGRPEILTLENNTDEAQTMDVTIHLMSFHTKEDWEKYQELLRLLSNEQLIEYLSILKDMLEEIKKLKQPKIKIKEVENPSQLIKYLSLLGIIAEKG